MWLWLQNKDRWADMACFPVHFHRILVAEDEEVGIWKKQNTMAAISVKEALAPPKYARFWEDLGATLNYLKVWVNRVQMKGDKL